LKLTLLTFEINVVFLRIFITLEFTRSN